MSAGFVYILLNPSFPDQVKIGLTKDKTEIRAKQLQSTGVPTPFIVVYDELVDDCATVEKRLHDQFSGYRVSTNREFFRIPVKEAVQALQREVAQSKPQMSAERVSIFDEMTQKYGSYITPDVVNVEIVQMPDVCFLEVTRQKYDHGHDAIIEREDLGFIVDIDDPMFPPEAPVAENAARFLDEFSEYDMIMAGLPIFSEAVAQRIAENWERPGGKLDQRRRRSS